MNYSVHVNAKAISIKYGVANPTTVNPLGFDMFTANIVGSGAGVSDEVKGLIAQKLSFATDRAANSPVSGSYTFTLSLTNTTDATTAEDTNGDTYTIILQQVSNEFVVNKSDLEVSVTVAPAVVEDVLTYDTSDQALLSSYGSGRTGEVENLPLEFSFDGGANWVTAEDVKKANAGTYTISYRVAETDNYVASLAPYAYVSKTIGQGTPTLTLPSLNTGLTYDGLNHPIAAADGVTTLGAVAQYKVQKWNGTTWENGSSSADASTLQVKDAGRYKIKGQIVETTNYSAVAYQTTEAEFVIAPATLKPSIKAGQSKEYGDADPANFVAEYDGFQNGETAATAAGFNAPTMERATGENAGVYAITMSQDGAADNYTFDYSLATQVNFSITAKALNDDDFTYAAPADQTYTGSPLTPALAAAPRFNGVDMTENTDYTLSYANNTNKGTATVTITGKGNFKGSKDLTFAIGAGNIYIIPTADTKEYGTSDPPSFAYTLKVGDETVPNSTLHGTVELARVAGENVGTYKIYVVSYTAHATETDNYTVKNDVTNPVNARPATELADFTITASTTPLALKFKSTATAEKVYGEGNPAWDIDDLEVVSGLAGTDTWDAIKTSLGTPVFTIASEDVKDNATNQVTVTDLVSPAYPTVTVEPMDFSITARPIEVTLEDQAIAYGTALGQDNGTYWTITDGTLATGDTPAELGLTVKTVADQATYAVSTDAYEEVITAEITNTNYALTVIKGDLTVSAGAAITLNRTGDMDALIKAYDNQTINVTLDRNITRTEAWFAMVLPFETTVTELSSKYGYAVVNVLDEGNTDASKVKFKLHMQTIAANQPFLIKIATAKETPMDFGSKPIVYAADPMSKDVAGNEFHGVFKETELAASDYLWTMIPAQNSFKKLDQSGTTLTPINAYLKTKDNLDAFAPTIFVEDFDFNSNTTAIKALNLENMKAYSVDGWYNMNGVKLQGVPTEKGIYINNGKKVVIK